VDYIYHKPNTKGDMVQAIITAEIEAQGIETDMQG